MDINTHVVNERDDQSVEALSNSDTIFKGKDTVKNDDYTGITDEIFMSSKKLEKKTKSDVLFLEEPEYAQNLHAASDPKSMYLFSILITVALIVSYYVIKKVVSKNASNSKSKQKV